MFSLLLTFDSHLPSLTINFMSRMVFFFFILYTHGAVIFNGRLIGTTVDILKRRKTLCAEEGLFVLVMSDTFFNVKNGNFPLS